jgi:hypothetical protein
MESDKFVVTDEREKIIKTGGVGEVYDKACVAGHYGRLALRRWELLEFLREEMGQDPIERHYKAEEMLLELLGDAEVTKEWMEAQGFWWYA